MINVIIWILSQPQQIFFYDSIVQMPVSHQSIILNEIIAVSGGYLINFTVVGYPSIQITNIKIVDDNDNVIYTANLGSLLLTRTDTYNSGTIEFTFGQYYTLEGWSTVRLATSTFEVTSETVTVYPCFTKNAVFETEDSTKTAEQVVIGDHIRCIDGSYYLVAHIFRMALFSTANMIKFAANSIGTNVPTNDLLLTSAHMVAANGEEKKASDYVNGTTITNVVENVEYLYHFHVNWANEKGQKLVTFAYANGLLIDVWGNNHSYIKKYLKHTIQ